MRSEFDPAAAARELLSGAKAQADDPRVIARATQLERDLLMSGQMRGVKGAARTARVKTKSGLAYVLANLIAITAYSAVLAVILILVRVNYGTSFDAAIDSVQRFFGGEPK